MRGGNQSGYSLVETLITVGLLGFLALGLLGFANVSFKAYGDTSNALREIRDVRVAMDRAVTELRSGKKAEITNLGKTLVYQRYDDEFDRSLYLGEDKRLYMDGTPITRLPVIDMKISYNSHDPQQKTIDIVVTLNDGTSLTATVRPFNQ